MPRLVQMKPGRNCVAGDGDTIQTPDGHQFAISKDAVKGMGSRFQFVYVGKAAVDSGESVRHDIDIGESRSPALAGK